MANVFLALLASGLLLQRGSAAPAAPAGENLASLGAGTVVAVEPTPLESGSQAAFLIDENPQRGWVGMDEHVRQPIVFELADRSVIHAVQFDTGDTEIEERLAKRYLVEMSDTSATAGFKTIADVTLAARMKDGQVFKTTADVPGRWIRITLQAMHSGTSTITQLMEFRAFGDRLTHTTAPPVTGTYAINDGPLLHLKQDGTTVTGCFEGDGGGPVSGGLEGRVLRFNWKLSTDEGPAIAVFGDGALFGGYWKTNGVESNPPIQLVDLKKKGTATGDCPNWHTADPIADELKTKGRVRLYGINFDSDSDVLRPESKSTLDHVVATLKKDTALQITIEGHTDSTSTPQHNQQLSEKRAAAVKAYLVTAGVDAARLATAGFGATKPVAPNDSALGRAENRRVELVRK
jgi:OOP family OmpA-OmpF porin